LRVNCDNVPSERLTEVLEAGWQLGQNAPHTATVGFDEVRRLQTEVNAVNVASIRAPYVELVHRIRHAGIPVSDRRAVKLQKLLAASAVLCGRTEARVSDFWVLRFIWDTIEQQEVLKEIIDQSLAKAEADAKDHPRARISNEPDAEGLARDLDAIGVALQDSNMSKADRAYLRDRLAILEGRCQWVTDTQKRAFLTGRLADLWKLAPQDANA
jgi:MoxR-like ATPase